MTEVCPARAAVELPPRGRFIAWQALAWVLAAPLLGAAVARAAVWAEHVRAPLLIFPLLIGVGLGLLLVAMLRTLNIGHRPTLIIGAVLAAVVAVVGQHYLHYRDFVYTRAAMLAEKADQGLAGAFTEMMPAPPSFADYMLWQAERAARSPASSPSRSLLSSRSAGPAPGQVGRWTACCSSRRPWQ